MKKKFDKTQMEFLKMVIEYPEDILHDSYQVLLTKLYNEGEYDPLEVPPKDLGSSVKTMSETLNLVRTGWSTEWHQHVMSKKYFKIFSKYFN